MARKWEMSRDSSHEFSLRLMTADDVGRVPIGCQGDQAALRARIADVGSAAVLAFDGDQHVAQLQFRRYDPDCRSPNGLWDPLYWGEFGEHAPALPAASLSIFCYHVGQLDDTERRDARYQGRGLGRALLDHLLAWAAGTGFAAIAAKATPPHRAVMSFMGGQPASVYEACGFEVEASWIDRQLLDVVHEKARVPEGTAPDAAARVSLCVKNLAAGAE